MFKKLNVGTLQKWLCSTKNNAATNTRVERVPRYKNFVQICIESNRVASTVELYLGVLYHFSAGLSLVKIRIF